MSDNWTGKNSTNWYSNGTRNSRNWSNNVPAVSATGTQSVTVNGSATNQPVIAPGNAPSEIVVAQTLNTGGAGYTTLTESQIDGEYITLTAGADLTIQGIAMGVFYGNSGLTAQNATMTGLHGALSTTASYDSHMSLIAVGNDTLTVDTVNENFGLISVASGNTLTIYNAIGGNAQQLHGLINYGLITVSAGGHLNITAQGSSGTTVANFYNAGWIEVDGGTLSISSSVLDGANTASTATTTDGYIEIGGGGDAILSNTVAATEQVNFTDSAANTLQITAGTLFSGTVNNFGAGDTILVNGFTSTSNATITTVGGVTELITTNGSVLTTITLTGSINSNFTTGTNSSGQEFIVSGGNTLSSNTTYTAGSSTLTGTGGTLSNNSTVAVTGTGTTVDLASTVTGTGAFFIDNGATLALTNPTGNDAGQTVSFGTNGSVAHPNTLLINDNSSGFGGQATGFGANDDIVLGGSVLPALTSGVGVTESYSGGVLTVSETNAAGSVLNTTTVQIAGTGLSTASFVALENGNGINIELAPAAATTYSFSVSGSFEDYHNYAGGVAPGDVLSPSTTVAIGAGTASVASGGVTDNGLITIASGATFLDAGSLSGTGSLSIAAGGAASLTGSTTLGGITDAGTLTLGGTDAVAISLASGAQATLASNFADTSAITGAGTLTVKSGVTGSLAAGSSIASVLDSGTLNLGGAFSGSINMGGNGANSVVDFNAANAAAQLTNFGTTDDIILGNGALTTPVAGDGLVLSYSTATNSLTITETNSSGSVIGTDVVSVTGTASLTSGSFVALESSKGINIELAPTAAATYSFSASGSFEDYHNYAGGVAPGDVLSPNTTVAIGAGTASVSSGGVTDNGLISIASGAGFVDAGSLSGTGSLSIAAGGNATLTGATTLGGITDAGTLTLGGTDAVAISLASGAQATLASNFADSSAITGAGTLTVKSGVTGSLAAGSSIASVLDSGTLNLGGAFSGSINMGGNGANSVVDFNAANAAAQLTNFGTTDDIILGNGALTTPVAGDGLVLSYSTATNSLTITETNSSGSVIGTDVVSVTGTASLTSGSFVALESSKGINIELAPTAAATYSFSASGSFEDYHNYAGGVAPGDVLSPNTTVAIGAGTASVSSGGVTDNGLITIASGAGFLDAGSLSGTGSLSIAAGGAASLTGSTTLGGITDAGTLTLGGTDAVAISLASGAQATLASNFADTSAITGAGTLTVKSGVTGSLAAGSSIGSVLDSGTLNLAGSFAGSINMEGNGANSVVDFNAANAAAQLTNFGTTDDIILGNGALTTPVAGDGLVLSYSTATNSLTITETNSSGSVIGTDTVSVTGTASLSSGSFVALESSKGINIELAPTAAATYSFSASGSFEDYHNYAGGVAPGDVLSPNTTVAIGAGTASVSSGGVTDNGLITIASGATFLDAGSLSGTGSLSIAAGGAASLTGSTTLGGITDAGTLTLGGTDAVAISLASGAQATLASNFADTSAITGAGTLTVNAGVTGTLGGSVALGAILDHGTIDITGTAPVSAINMLGDNAGSVVEFTPAAAVPTLISFGTGDEIIVSGVNIPAGDGLLLSYDTGTGVLTGIETDSTGGTVGTDSATVTGVTGTSFSTASFVALEGATGVTIELAPTTATTYNFSASGTGSFEDYQNYAGGVAPGDVLSPNTTVNIGAGTASVASGGVTDNGLITVASGATFFGANSLSGTGALGIAAGGAATLTGSTTLGGITDAGTLTLGGTDAVAISLAAGAQATLASNFADSAAITGAGTLTVNAGVTGSLAAGSSIGSVLDSGTLNLAGSFGGSIDMQGNGANSVADFQGANVTNGTLNTAITDFGTGDELILSSAAFALNSGDSLTSSYSAGELTVTDTTNHTSVTVNLGLTAGDPSSILEVSDATGQLVITLCFYAGTALATPGGEIKVEDIVAGDMVMTTNGAKTVRWIGQSHVHTSFADPLRSLPIRIRQGALGNGLPVRDLLLSPDHAIHFGGILVQASALVNGGSIVREYDVPAQFTYYHVELDSHELLLAEGVEAESFVDNVDRMHFHNWDEREAPATQIAEMDLPRAKSARQLPQSIRNQLAPHYFAVA